MSTDAINTGTHVPQGIDRREPQTPESGRRGLIRVFTSIAQRWRQWQAPTGIPLDVADRLLKEHDAEVSEIAGDGRDLAMHDIRALCANRLMDLVHRDLPEDVMRPEVRAYFLDRGGYLGNFFDAFMDENRSRPQHHDHGNHAERDQMVGDVEEVER